MIKKRTVVRNTTEINSVLTDVVESEGDIILSSKEYLQIGHDLRDLPGLTRILANAIDTNKGK